MKSSTRNYIDEAQALFVRWMRINCGIFFGKQTIVIDTQNGIVAAMGMMMLPLLAYQKDSVMDGDLCLYRGF